MLCLVSQRTLSMAVGTPNRTSRRSVTFQTFKSTPSSETLIQLILVPILFYIGAKLSLVFAVTPDVLVMLWLPNSVLLAALLHFQFRRYFYFIAAVMVAEVAADYPTFSLAEAVLFGAINSLEVTLAYTLLRRWRFNPRFAAPSDLAKFVLAGPVIAAFASAVAASSVYEFFRGAHASYFEFLRVWWFSDGLGLLILTPLALSLWPAIGGEWRPRASLQWYDAIALFGALLILAAFLLSDQGMFYGLLIRPVLLIPVLVYAAARFCLRTTTATLAAVTLLLVYVTGNGQQPFGDLPLPETVIWGQEYIFIMSVMSLGLVTLLTQLRANTRELEARVEERTTELRTANTQLQKLAVTDALTGLLNRRALFNLLRREISRAQRHPHALAVIMFDIDHFKQVNDRYGHAAGDAVLRHVAAVAKKISRSTDSAARYGGEEFVVVAPETEEGSAIELAARMHEALRASDVSVNRQKLRVTASFGVAMLHIEDRQPEDVLRRADQALYQAKATGRDRVVVDREDSQLPAF